MTTTTVDPATGTQTLARRKLASWAPWAFAAGALVLAFLLVLVLGTPTFASVGALAIVLYAVGLTLTSRIVEGERQATDRLATTLITLAFGVALIPLVSLLWTVVVEGSKRFSPTFLNTNMVGSSGT